MNEYQSSLLSALIELNQKFRSLLSESYQLQVNLGETSVGLLKVLADQQLHDLTQSQIAQRLSVSESTLCTLIEKLRRDGLVIRERLATDRRKTKLSLTDNGACLSAKISSTEQQLEGRLTEIISDRIDIDVTQTAVQELKQAMQVCLHETETNRRAA